MFNPKVVGYAMPAHEFYIILAYKLWVIRYSKIPKEVQRKIMFTSLNFQVGIHFIGE